MRRPRLLMTVLAVAACGSALAQVSALGCGELTNAFGPFDYRPDRDRSANPMPHRQRLMIVEETGRHFTPRIEALIGGETGPIGVELDYTLRVFPNHHRALLAVMRFGEKINSPQPATLPRPVECYFERALRFQPDDTTARLLYTTFLTRGNRKPEALQQLERARFHAGDNGFTHYNIGLVFLDVGEPEQALVQAHRAMSLGFERAGLKDKLVALGRWQDPAPSAPSSDAASAPVK